MCIAENNITRFETNFLVLQPVVCQIKHNDGSTERFNLLHTLNEGQIGWFKAGSALNRMAELKH